MVRCVSPAKYRPLLILPRVKLLYVNYVTVPLLRVVDVVTVQNVERSCVSILIALHRLIARPVINHSS